MLSLWDCNVLMYASELLKLTNHGTAIKNCLKDMHHVHIKGVANKYTKVYLKFEMCFIFVVLMMVTA